MMQLSEGAIFDALRTVQEPELGRDIVTLNMVKGIQIDGDRLAFTIELTTPACPLKDEIERNVHAALQPLGVQSIDITWGSMVRRAKPRSGAAAPAGRQEHHRDRVGQGRRRQEHRLGQSRRRARADWAPRWGCSTPTSPAPTCR